ncbi:MAG: hypothetical protein Q8P44_00510 [Dehalococcoidia bacterium]|nr:hypothetical protein [Dehalococcoidia bacterium]
MKLNANLIKSITAGKQGWSREEINSWIRDSLADLKTSSPELWQFIDSSQEDLFKSICNDGSDESNRACPADEARRFLLLRLLELAEVFNAQLQIEELDKLWKTEKHEKTGE